MNERRRALLRSLAALTGLGLAAACAPAASPARTQTSPPTSTVPPAVPLPPRPSDGPPTPTGAGRPAAPSSAVGPATAASPTVPAAEATRREGGAVVQALAAEPEALDPANAVTLAAETAGRPLYDGLLSFGPSFEPRPALAERWAVSPDGLLYTFYLRPGVKFQDGTPFNAQAAQYNFERLLGDEKPRRRELTFSIVHSAHAVDELTLEVALERPFSPELHQVAQFGAAMVSPEAHRTWRQELGSHPVGTGPFRLAEWKRGDRLTFERWDGSWHGPPALDGIVLTAVPDDSARLLLLEAGEIQLAGPISADLLPRVEADSRLRADVVQSARALGIAINTQVDPFKDRRVRQALNYAVDREALVKNAYSGLATPLGGPVAPAVRGAAPLAAYPFDPTRARKLLAEAGFPNGLEAPLLGGKGRFPGDVALLQEVQKQLQAVGVRTRLELLDTAQLIGEITKAADETALRLSLAGWLPPSGEVRGALYPLFHSSQWMPRGQNTSFFKNAQFDDLLERGTRAAEPAERDRLFNQAQQLIYDEAPWIFLVSPKTVIARAARLHEPALAASELVTITKKTWLE